MELNSFLENEINDYYDKHFTPAYFYDLNEIRKNIRQISESLPKQVSLYYAMKANNHKKIMKEIISSDKIKGIEIASYGELKIAKKKIAPQKIIFTGPGKTCFELKESIKNKIRFINVESVVEAIRINDIAKKLNIKEVNILLRINLNYSVENAQEKMSGISTKMGIDENDVYKSYEYIKKLERVKIKGIHVFAASGILDYMQLIKCNKYIFDLVKKLEKKGIKIDVVDFGGGIGVDYSEANQKFDIKSYNYELKKLIKEYSFENKEFIMELGTYFVANAGYYTAPIIDIKEVKKKKHIIIAGGVNHSGLQLEMRRKHPVGIIRKNIPKLYKDQPYIENEKVDISGPLCMVSDKLSWDEKISKADIGDIIIYFNSGAYCYSEGLKDFLSHKKPREIIIDDKEETKYENM